MGSHNITAKTIKLAVYLIAIVLINVVGLTLFFRVDLTANKLFSISEVSRKVVSSLAEPLTINVFFTKNLPAPHNNTERYLHDILAEYAISANKNFNYRFYDVSTAEGDNNTRTQANRDLATTYGISPVQIQLIEQDEVKFQNAFMGMVLIHGDMVERIGAITSTDGLEYQITTAIQKLNNKISAFLNIEDKIRVRLFLSSSLLQVAPLMQLNDLGRLPQEIEKIVDRLNGTSYGKLAFERLDPSTDSESAAEVNALNLMQLQWPAVPKRNLEAGTGAVGLVVAHGAKSVSIPLVQVLQLPLIGTHYQLADLNNLQELINNALEAVIDIHSQIGYLADHGTLSAGRPRNPMGPQPQTSINNFRAMVSKTYSIKDVNLTKDPIPPGLESLIIARPTEPFSDYALYQIDQFLMRGKNLVLFVDRLREIMPQQGGMMGGQPAYVPVDTGLEKLLAHYGIKIQASYVLDEHCYKQQVPRELGGGERSIYFAPIIKNKNINKDLDFIKDIKGMVTIKASPVEIDEKALKDNGIRVHRLLRSSTEAWEIRERINLNPVMMTAPPPENERRQFDLAYLLEGSFKSYFDGKPIPAREIKAPENPAAQADGSQEPKTEGEETAPEQKKPELTGVAGKGEFIAAGKAAKVFVMAASEMLSDSIIDEQGRSPNDVFILNTLDALSGREEVATMRSKEQRFNPLVETGAGTKTVLKAFNIAGLPILVVLFGLLMWFRRYTHQKNIKAMFQNGDK